MSIAQGGQSSAAPIPDALNIGLLIVACAAAALCLRVASHAESWWIAIAAAVVFSYVNNTIFSLMHEAVHGVFNADRRLNEAGGRIAAAFFPTAFALQRVFHEAHHANNRSEVERFDYYSPNENRPLKFLQWYCILTGLYWLGPPIFSAVYALTAGLIDWKGLASRGSGFARQTAADEFLESLGRVSVLRARLDSALAFVLQASLFYGLGLSLAGWLLCYACFAVSWSSLQYADHAFSALDRVEGAWNLRFNPMARVMFLNYNLHLNHHRSPATPWLHLPMLTRAEDEARSFWAVYLAMWRGPRPLPAGKNSGLEA